MLIQRAVVVSGDLGSGKSTVSQILASRLGYPRISMGDLHRKMAEERGMSALQLNLHAERDESIDNQIDQLQVQMAESGEPLIVDSRLAWYFFPQAFKIHLVVDPAIGASRAVSRPASGVESYSSLSEAVSRLQERSDSERARFLVKYNVDKGRLRNYDMVADSSRARPEAICDDIIAALRGDFGSDTISPDPPILDLDPTRIHLGQDFDRPANLDDPKASQKTGQVDGLTLEPISVAYCEGRFYVVDGVSRLKFAVDNGLTLIRARLVAEGEEKLFDDRSACSYFNDHVSAECADG